MNDSFLVEFYNDLFCQNDDDTPTTYEYKKAKESIEEHGNYFRKTLKDEDNLRFDRLDCLHNTVNSQYGCHNFVCGFRLAIRLLLDALYAPE